MPVYEYDCPDCGPFRSLRSMSSWNRPARCPSCGMQSPRAVCAPHIRDARATLHFHIEERNQRSAHEPKVVQHVGRKNQDLEDHGYTRHRNRHDAHGHYGHRHGHGQASRHRPWMIGH